MGRLVELHESEIPAAAHIACGLVVHHDLVYRTLLDPVPVIVKGVLQGIKPIPMAAQDQIYIGTFGYYLIPQLLARS